MQVQQTTDSIESIKQEVIPDKGIHILGDFFGCKSGKEEMLHSEMLRSFCRDKVKEVGLTEVGELFYQFPGGGVTGTVLLAESHVAIHTWPEKDYLTLDIFVCNVTQDNTQKAKTLYQEFVRLFRPEHTNHQEIERE